MLTLLGVRASSCHRTAARRGRCVLVSCLSRQRGESRLPAVAAQRRAPGQSCGKAASLLPQAGARPRRANQLPFTPARTRPAVLLGPNHDFQNTCIPLQSLHFTHTRTGLQPSWCAQARHLLPLVAARRIPTGRAESCSGKGLLHPGGPARQSVATGPACGRGPRECHTPPATSPASLSRRSQARTTTRARRGNQPHRNDQQATTCDVFSRLIPRLTPPKSPRPRAPARASRPAQGSVAHRPDSCAPRHIAPRRATQPHTAQTRPDRSNPQCVP